MARGLKKVIKEAYNILCLDLGSGCCLHKCVQFELYIYEWCTFLIQIIFQLKNFLKILSLSIQKLDQPSCKT